MSLIVLALALVAGCDRFFYPPIKAESSLTSRITYSKAQQADELAYINNQIAQLTKAGIGQPVRELNYELLQNSSTVNAKLLYGNRLLEAFDSQLWNMTTDPRIINSPLRDNFQEKSIKELANFIPNLTVNHPPLSALATGNNMASFYAIVSSLHKINNYRDIFREKIKIEDQSMLDIIQSALSKEAAVRNGEIAYDNLSKTEIEVLKRASTFRYCIMIRHRYLPLLALARISQTNDGLFFKIRNLFKKALPEFADLYTYQFDTAELNMAEEKSKHSIPHYQIVKKLNLVQLYYAQESIDQAIAARRYLKSLGFSSVLDPKVRAIFMNLQISYSDVPNSGNTQVTEARLDLIDGLNRKIKELLAEE